MRDNPRLLIVNHKPEAFLPMIRAKLAEQDIAVCSHARDLPATIAQHRPDIAFATRMPGTTPADYAPLCTAPSVRWIQACNVGIEHLGDWDPRIIVTNCAGVLSDFNAEYIFGAIMSVNAGFALYRDQQKQRQWQPHERRGLRDQTVLIIGLGAIGGRVATRAKAFGMRVIGIRAHVRPTEHVDEVLPLEALPSAMPRADFIVVIVPVTASTRGLVGARLLDLAKPGAVLINAARGGIVDEAALANCLKSGRLKAAVIDVFAEEPLPADSPLWGIDNLHITPHISGTVTDWRERWTAFFLENLERFRTGQPLSNVVDPARRY